MILPESKAKLEDKAKESYSKVPWQYVNNSSFDSVYRNGFMAGATAAWQMATELAVKAERERINPHLEAVRRMIQEAYIKNWSEETLRALVYTCVDKLSAILNPPKDEA